MDFKQLAQDNIDDFNDRSFSKMAKDLAVPGVVVMDMATGQELKGVDGYVQFNQGFVTAMPDVKGTVIEHKVSGNKVTSRVRGQGTFTGTLQMPQGNVPGNGNHADIEYQIQQEFDEAGKLTRFTVSYDMADFARQLGIG